MILLIIFFIVKTLLIRFLGGVFVELKVTC